MKRQAKRVILPLTPEKMAELRQVRETIHRDEKDELSAKARKVLRGHTQARQELTRAAELLRCERAAQGLSLTDLEERTGISRSALSRLENLVDSNPTVATLDRIARALGKELDIGLRERVSSK